MDFGNIKVGKFVFFGIGGRSDIDFFYDEIDENDFFVVVDEDVFVKFNFGVFGLCYNLIFSDKVYL